MFLVMEVQDYVDSLYAVVEITPELVGELRNARDFFKEVYEKRHTSLVLSRMRYWQNVVSYYDSIEFLDDGTNAKEVLDDEHFVFVDFLPEQDEDAEVRAELNELVVDSGAFRWSCAPRHVDRYYLTQTVRFEELEKALKERKQ